MASSSSSRLARVALLIAVGCGACLASPPDPGAGPPAAARSPRTAESMFLAGEAHFEAGELDEAVTAYAAVVASGDPGFATLGRYKLGWSYYRRGSFAAAVATFQELLDHSPKESTAAGLLREATLYAALSLTDPDWNGDGDDDPAPPDATSASVARVAAHLRDGASPTRRAVTAEAATALRAEARLTEAAAVDRLLLAVTTEPAERAALQAAPCGGMLVGVVAARLDSWLDVRIPGIYQLDLVRAAHGWEPAARLAMPHHHATALELINLAEIPTMAAGGLERARVTLELIDRDLRHDPTRQMWFATYRARVIAACAPPPAP